MHGRRIPPKFSMIVIASSAFVFAAACKQPGARRASLVSSDSDPASALISGPLAETRSEDELRALFQDTLRKTRAIAGQGPAAKTSQKSAPSPLQAFAAAHAPYALNVKLRAPSSPAAKVDLASSRAGIMVRAAGGVVRRYLATSGIMTIDFKEAINSSDADIWLAAALTFLKNEGTVAEVEPDYLIPLVAVPDDPRFKDQRSFRNDDGGKDVAITPAWNLTTGNKAIVVATIDSGIDCNHEDLTANCWVNPGESGNDSAGQDKRTNGVDDDGNGLVDDWQGWNFFSNNNRPFDDNGHGTHVAGIIGAVGNNGKGVAGINWNVSLVPLKAFDASGMGTVSAIIASLDYAAKMGITLTNNSYGQFDPPRILEQAVIAARDKGVFMSCAAGNAGKMLNQLMFGPATYPYDNIIAVTAVDDKGAWPKFANSGHTSIDLAAPGVDVLSTTPDNHYERLTGTSMATPHVTGALALMKAAFPDATYQDLAARVIKGVTVIPENKYQCASGGMLNVFNAMKTPSDTVAPSPPRDITVTDRDAIAAKISFTPGLDDNDNPASQEAPGHEIRFSRSRALSEKDWADAAPLAGTFARSQGTVSFTATNLPATIGADSGFVTVRATDRGGNMSPLVAAASVDARPIPFRRVQFYDGTALDDLAGATPWVIESDPVRGPVFSDGPGKYTGNSTRRMTLRGIPLAGVQRVVLQYMTSYALEDSYDFGDILVRRRGPSGDQWKRVERVTGTRPWHLRTVDLTAQAFEAVAAGDDTLQVAFELVTDAQIEFSGWLVDDISILVNDSLVTLAGVPASPSDTASLNVNVGAPANSKYTFRLAQSATPVAVDCYRDETFDVAVPETPVTRALVFAPLDDQPFKFLCVRVQAPGYAGYTTTWAKWTRNSGAARVTAAGQPVGRSNADSFTLRVTPSTPAVAWSSALIMAPGQSPGLACEGPAAAWSEWRVITDRARIAIPAPLPSNDAGVPVVLCVRGKDSAGRVQVPATYYEWVADYAHSAPVLGGLPPALNNARVFDVQINGTRDLGECAATLVPGASACPNAWTSYSRCTRSPGAHQVSVPAEGPWKLCVLTRDIAGNQAPVPVSYSWTSDFTQAPAALQGTPPLSAKFPGTPILVSGKDVVSFRYARGKSVTDCASIAPWSAVLPVATPVNLSLVPGADGPQVLCVRGIDAAGNEQDPPATLTWRQDTLALPIKFGRGLPATFSNAKSIEVTMDPAEPGAYRATVVPGTSCFLDSMRGLPPVPVSQKFTADLPTDDGSYALCAQMVDEAGNVQAEPTRFIWSKDTTPPAYSVTGAPSGYWSVPSMSVRVLGADIATWQWAVVNTAYDGYPLVDPGCAGAAYSPPMSALQFLNTPLGGQGPRTLCIKARDSIGNIQPAMAAASWIQTTAKDPAAVLSGALPVSPSSQTKWTWTVRGNNVAQYQFALLASRDSKCDSAAVTWSPFQPVTVPLAIDNSTGAAAGDGYKTLCLRGRTAKGVVQAFPSITRWLQFAAADRVQTLYGTMTRRSVTDPRRAIFDLTRASGAAGTEQVSVRVCALTPATGRVGPCVSNTANFAGTVTEAFTLVYRIPAGDLVVIGIPPAGKGRIEPFLTKN